ncbi:MAG: hypothetical protein IJ083_11145 [Clostridia bacterium]|nr:hypothetical protein [Clostridia bacterium]
MKLALVGQDIPSYLPSMLTDLLQVGHEPATVCLEEKNGAMQDLLLRYGRVCFDKANLGGAMHVWPDRREVLRDADVVIYAGDQMASSRFKQDREALMGASEDDPGLVDQARANGGIGGLLHALRQGSQILPLVQAMREVCPKARVITLGQPVARTAYLFHFLGFETYGLAKSVLRGPSGVDGIAGKLGLELSDLDLLSCGLPEFAFMYSANRVKDGADIKDRIEAMASEGELGRLCRRWYRQYEAVAVGSVTDHAAFMEAQEDYEPEADPQLSESVEHRKNRILHMNTAGEKGLSDPDGMIAQLSLLTRTSPLRPVQLALALVRGEDLMMDGVTHINAGDLLGLPRDSMVETRLVLHKGQMVPQKLRLSPEITDLMCEIDEANRWAAHAATGDRSALREYVETDPALAGLDRLYLMDVVNALIRMHEDILTQFSQDEDEDDDLY